MGMISEIWIGHASCIILLFLVLTFEPDNICPLKCPLRDDLGSHAPTTCKLRYYTIMHHSLISKFRDLDFTLAPAGDIVKWLARL